jgi:hypothetical protein
MTDECREWYDGLGDEGERVDAIVDLLWQYGPSLRRPYVGDIEGSDLDGLKELVVKGGEDSQVRILFKFDPRRVPILLHGGDKAKGGEWNDWYPDAINEAERLYEEHMEQLRKEGLI